MGLERSSLGHQQAMNVLQLACEFTFRKQLIKMLLSYNNNIFKNCLQFCSLISLMSFIFILHSLNQM